MRWRAIRQGLCPHCLEGEIFAGRLKMHARCPLCDIEFEREHGFFLMSIFFGYVLGFVLLLPLVIALYVSGAPLWGYGVGVTAVLAVFTPFIFRYARIIWLHVDEVLDPRP